MKQECSFRRWCQNLQLWLQLTELQPHQQVAAIILRLDGTARECADMLTTEERHQGGYVGDQYLGPLEYLLYGLSRRFAPLEEETRLRAMMRLVNFHRQGHETMDELLARFECVCTEARDEGRYVLTIAGYTLTLLRAIGINQHQLKDCLQPLRGRFPTTEEELEEIKAYLRRTYRSIDGHPGNVGALINPAGFRNHLSLTDADPTSFHQVSTFMAGPCYNGGSPGAPRFDSHEQEQFWGRVTPAHGWHPDHSYLLTAAHNTLPTIGSDGTVQCYQSLRSSPMKTEDTDMSGTDTDTSSDDMAEELYCPELAGVPEPLVEQVLWARKSHAKRAWRRYTKKPVRKVRRFIRKRGGRSPLSYD